MSLQAIKAVLNKARLNPRLAQVDIPGTELFEALSRASQIFLQLLADLPTTGGNLRLVDCTVRDWDTVDRNYFLHMNREDQLEVLGVLTAIQHEWTHHLDLLSTPFGVNVHTKEVTEFLIFQELAPWLLEVPGERLASPLVDTLTESTFPGWARTHPSADLHSPEALLQGLAGKVFFDDYMTGAPQRHVEDGWYGGKDVIAIAGKKVECVTVNRVWPGYGPPSSDSRTTETSGRMSFWRGGL